MKLPKAIKTYMNDITEQFIILHPEYSDKKEIVKKCMIDITKEYIKNPKARFGDEDTTLLAIINMIEEKNPIISGYGTMFLQHDEKLGIEYKLVDDFTVLRKKNKDKMFEHINDEDQSLYNMFNGFQQTFKILGNSYFGINTQKDSFFYHPLLGPTITQTGVLVITTAINLFEKILTNNFKFRRFTDCMIYINNILKEDYDIEDYIDKYVSKKKFREYLKKKFVKIDNYIEEKIELLVKNLSKSERSKVYYKNNFYEFVDNSELFRNKLIDILGNEDFLNPNKTIVKDDDGNIVNDYTNALNELWEIYDIVLIYNYMDFYRYENVRFGNRKAILTNDTDSAFLYLFPFFAYCQSIKKFKDNNVTRLTTTNIAMYWMTSAITKCYEMLTKNFNIEDKEKRKLINMKNEFFILRIMLTDGKKNYATLTGCKEGRIYDNPKPDIKGLAIKKVNTNKIVREDYTKLLVEDILKCKDISVSKIFNDFIAIKEKIEKNIKTGDTEFSSPGKVNEISSYKIPLQQQTVRGSIIWNAIYPEDEIIFPDKINSFKLNIMQYAKNEKETEIEIIERLILEDEELEDSEKTRIIDTINRVIYGDEKYAHFGFKIICFPKSVKKLPSWIIKIIDVNKMVEDHLKSGLPVLKTVGLNITSYQVGDEKGEVLSNIMTQI